MKLVAIFKPQGINVSVSNNSLHASTGTPVVKEYVGADPFEGPYEVTPVQNVQVLQTLNKRMTANFTINPIPSNYGLITWDGTILTVS